MQKLPFHSEPLASLALADLLFSKYNCQVFLIFPNSSPWDKSRGRGGWVEQTFNMPLDSFQPACIELSAALMLSPSPQVHMQCQAHRRSRKYRTVCSGLFDILLIQCSRILFFCLPFTLAPPSLPHRPGPGSCIHERALGTLKFNFIGGRRRDSHPL